MMKPYFAAEQVVVAKKGLRLISVNALPAVSNLMTPPDKEILHAIFASQYSFQENHC